MLTRRYRKEESATLSFCISQLNEYYLSRDLGDNHANELAGTLEGLPDNAIQIHSRTKITIKFLGLLLR